MHKATVAKGENGYSMETSDDSFGANKVKYHGLQIATVESGDEVSVSFELANKKRRLLSASAVEDVIMGKELLDTHISLAQNLRKAGTVCAQAVGFTINIVSRENKSWQKRRQDATNCALYQSAPLDCHQHHRQQRKRNSS